MRKVTQQRFGGPEVLEVVTAERPVAGPGEVLVKVAASGLNPVDAAVRSGFLPLLGEGSFTLGWDVAGVVEAVGPGAGFAVGDEVYGMPNFPGAAGGYAEYVAAPAAELAAKPAGLSFAEAAALPLAGLTAWQSLVTAAGLTAGQRVLIHRAAGGVGHLAVQIAKARGAHVIGLAGAAKHEFLRSLGADEVIDYRATDYTEVLSGLDVVLDSSAEGDRSLRVLREGGVLVSIMQHHDQELAARVRAAGRRFEGVSVQPDAAGLAGLSALVEAGRLRPHLAEVLPLAEVARAHELLDTGRTQGKIVLAV
ncbi:NADPH:quinone reductase [Kitasatospora sp. MMS16-BH015]|uniref:NADP-dependent oxidoreductase n=1 Tax=Kitasatospora sp. MMS16-BH015 TaxID=2018025 RepID=UPI000CA26EDE|nr:NADP-dependent oxidoreductase [Kitasatospora sp. MMS16-BH015]AUG79774.1 NADPH:quinone reductase [Kitasatospora sp. MMS16-BH015]